MQKPTPSRATLNNQLPAFLGQLVMRTGTIGDIGLSPPWHKNDSRFTRPPIMPAPRSVGCGPRTVFATDHRNAHQTKKAIPTEASRPMTDGHSLFPTPYFLLPISYSLFFLFPITYPLFFLFPITYPLFFPLFRLTFHSPNSNTAEASEWPRPGKNPKRRWQGPWP